MINTVSYNVLISTGALFRLCKSPVCTYHARIAKKKINLFTSTTPYRKFHHIVDYKYVFLI